MVMAEAVQANGISDGVSILARVEMIRRKIVLLAHSLD